MKFPKLGTWVRVYWQDAHQTGGWTYDDEEQSVVEVSSGLFRGVTSTAMAKIAPTVSMDMNGKDLYGKLTELSIPIGCILKIERLPKIPLK